MIAMTLNAALEIAETLDAYNDKHRSTESGTLSLAPTFVSSTKFLYDQDTHRDASAEIESHVSHMEQLLSQIS
jgi:hypothetical protein